MAQSSSLSKVVKEKVYCIGCKKLFKFVSKEFEHECNEPSNLFHCYVCKKCFDNRINYIDHIFEHTGMFICGICTEGFQDINTYKNHMDNHDAFFTFTCEVCNGSFLKIYSSNYFKKYHVCDTCHYGWKSKVDSCRKTRKYGRFACGHCQEKFSDNKTVALHLWSHKDIRPYVCGFCPFVESDYHEFLKHVFQHSAQ